MKEESIIDFAIGCQEMVDIVEGMLINEEKKYLLTKYRKTKKGVKIQESDHNTLITTVKATWNKKIKTKHVEVYNLKDPEGLKKFKNMTSKDKFLSEVFSDESKKIEVKTKQFLKRLGFCISKCFRKIRISQTKRNKKLDELFNKKRILKHKTDVHNLEELKHVEEQLAEMCAEDNYKLVKDAIKA